MKLQSLASFVVICLVLLEISHFTRVVEAKGGRGRSHHAKAKPKPKGGALREDFYKDSCPQAYDIVKKMTQSKVKENLALPARLIRLHYHDCFVRGCDASVLLDTEGGEKEARPNLSLKGFEVIDEIKTELERVCPSKVSCADILTLSARDAVSFEYGRDLWEVKTGRRDGVVSSASEANDDLPSPFANYTTLHRMFVSKKLNFIDLVALSGAHTIGVARCGTFSRRLYNFTGQGDADPSLDPDYAATLRKKCPNPLVDRTTTVEMDPLDSESFNSHYYTALARHQGLFQSDAALLTDPVARLVVERMKNDRVYFFRQFAASMVKMGAIDVLTGSAGEIRKNCHFFNQE